MYEVNFIVVKNYVYGTEKTERNSFIPLLIYIHIMCILTLTLGIYIEYQITLGLLLFGLNPPNCTLDL